MRGQRQKIRPEQGELAFPTGSRSDAPKPVEKGIETRVAKRSTESLAETERRMEEVCERENCKQALQGVKANKGSPGVIPAYNFGLTRIRSHDKVPRSSIVELSSQALGHGMFLGTATSVSHLLQPTI